MMMMAQDRNGRLRRSGRDNTRLDKLGGYRSLLMLYMYSYACSCVFLMCTNRILNVLDGLLFQCRSVGIILNKAQVSNQGSSHM